MRILKVDILTFNGFSDSKSDILKPRWLPTIEYLPAGSFASMPHGVVHYVLVDEDSIVQVNATGPWGIDYVNAKDDPRLNGVPDPSSDLYSSKQK